MTTMNNEDPADPSVHERHVAGWRTHISHVGMDRPILFSAPMVRAIIAGTKTQTRRVLRVQPPVDARQVSTWHHPSPRPMYFAWVPTPHGDGGAEISDWPPVPCPYGQPGDRLWVREAHALQNRYRNVWCTYAADGDRHAVPAPNLVTVSRPGLRPSIHMPRWASRITLDITGVRVERLQDISFADARAEGVAHWRNAEMLKGLELCSQYRYEFEDMWNHINGPGSWDADPWVWVIEFKVDREAEKEQPK